MSAVEASAFEAATGEELERVILHPMHGEPRVVERAQLLALDLAGLAVAYADGEGRVHRVVGLPLEVIAKKTDSRIIRPA